MSRARQGAGHRCNCLGIEPSTRRGFLTAISVLGLDLAGVPALAQPTSERPKEDDFLVAIDSERGDPLEPKDIPVGGPPVLAWPMDRATSTVRKDSRLNKIVLVHLDPTTLVGKKLPKVIGILRPLNIGSFNVWIIFPRSAADLTLQ